MDKEDEIKSDMTMLDDKDTQGADTHMNDEYSRFGIYVGKDGMLASSICHAHPGNAGKGECQHFSFAETSELAQRKLNYYLTERITGRLDVTEIDGTSGDYLSALQNWLILEKGYDRAELPYPDGDSLLHAWFHDDETTYRNIINEAKSTSLLGSLKIGDSQKEEIQAIAQADIPINIISDPSLGDNDDERISIDTAAWMSINGISDTAESSKPGIDDSSVNVISTGDARIDVHELEHLERQFTVHDDNDQDSETILNDRYIMNQSNK
jgi:hypothetical protein